MPVLLAQSKTMFPMQSSVLQFVSLRLNFESCSKMALTFITAVNTVINNQLLVIRVSLQTAIAV